MPHVEGATKINFVPLGNRLWLSSGLLCVADLVKMQAAEDDAAPARREERKDAAPHSKHFALPCIFLFVAQKCPFFLARDRNECPPQKGENCQLHKNKIKENKFLFFRRQKMLGSPLQRDKIPVGPSRPTCRCFYVFFSRNKVSSGTPRPWPWFCAVPQNHLENEQIKRASIVCRD